MANLQRTFPSPFLDPVAIANLVNTNKSERKGYIDESDDPAVTRLVPSATSQRAGDQSNEITAGNNNAILCGVNNVLDQDNSAVVAADGLDTSSLDQNYQNSEQLYLNNLYSEGGLVYLRNLPTADPEVVDQLWNNAGVLTVSAGPNEAPP